jgi:riboflavin-specific deaminase-like protein
VITGIGTVLADDPSLTDRSELSRRRPLLRVILDSHLRLPPDSKLVRSVKEDVLVFCANPPEPSLQALSAAGVVVRQIPSEPGSTRPSLSQILEHLGEMKITSVMVEAGSEVNASFLNAGLVDRLYLFYAPTLLGPEGVPMSQAAFIPDSPIRDFALHRFGNDLAYEARLQEYWHNPESLSLGIGALTAAAQDELELAGLAEKWGAGTFDSTAASLTYHFNAHGAELRAVSLLQYLRKADRFAAKLERSKRAPLPDGSVRYTENDRYAIKSADGKILSLGLVADERGRAD